jgi:hypothetical protein
LRGYWDLSSFLLSLLPGHYEKSTALLPTVMFCLSTSPKTKQPTIQGLKSLKPGAKINPSTIIVEHSNTPLLPINKSLRQKKIKNFRIK